MYGYLESSVELYQRSWDEINDRFSDYVEKNYKLQMVLSQIHLRNLARAQENL